MIEEHNNDESKTESELKPEERMPDAWGGGNDWVKEIEYEKILERVDRFQERTGLSDEQVEAILDGGNYKSILEMPLDDNFFKDMKEEYGLERDELIDEAFRIAMLVITNDKTIEQIETMEREAGFTPQQTAKILEGSAEYSSEVLDIMTSEYNLRDLKEMQNKGDTTTDEIANELEGIGRDSAGEDAIEHKISELHAKLVNVEQEEAEDQEQSAPPEPEKPKSFRERLKAEKPSTRNPGD